MIHYVHYLRASMIIRLNDEEMRLCREWAGKVFPNLANWNYGEDGGEDRPEAVRYNQAIAGKMGEFAFARLCLFNGIDAAVSMKVMRSRSAYDGGDFLIVGCNIEVKTALPYAKRLMIPKHEAVNSNVFVFANCFMNGDATWKRNDYTNEVNLVGWCCSQNVASDATLVLTGHDIPDSKGTVTIDTFILDVSHLYHDFTVLIDSLSAFSQELMHA